MNCHSFANIRDLHGEGRLSPRRAAAADAHLASCAACRAKAAPAAAPSGARAPLSLRDKIAAAAKAAPKNPAPPARPGPSLWPREARGIALAAAALAVVGLLIAAAGAPSQSSGEPLASVEVP
ncbi:MAG: zf-HC2 domain-containing protein [Elusimicrobiota bacterium]